MKMLKFTCSASSRLGVCMGCNWTGTNCSASSAMWSTHQKTQWKLCGFEGVVALFGKFFCVTMAVLGLSWIDALALQGRNLKKKNCAVFGTTLFPQRQGRSEFLRLAYFRNCSIVCTQHGLTKPNWKDSIFFNFLQAKCFKKNLNIPAPLCEQDLKQDCVGAKRPPRNFKHPDLSPNSPCWKKFSSAWRWCEEAVRIFWSNPLVPDCWTAAAPWTPRVFLGVQGV